LDQRVLPASCRCRRLIADRMRPATASRDRDTPELDRQALHKNAAHSSSPRLTVAPWNTRILRHAARILAILTVNVQRPITDRSWAKGSCAPTPRS
jgi:hypothetical protein